MFEAILTVVLFVIAIIVIEIVTKVFNKKMDKIQFTQKITNFLTHSGSRNIV